ncbi:hypothetical protein AAHE18_17G184200 [Arachis hypogaea]
MVVAMVVVEFMVVIDVVVTDAEKEVAEDSRSLERVAATTTTCNETMKAENTTTTTRTERFDEFGGSVPYPRAEILHL